MTRKEALRAAIEKAGGPTKVAEACGITPQAVSQWDECPSRHVHRVSALTGGEIPASVLRPDMFEAA
jgi:DNA-binding transcriptional regulator YdaS (Cro superfamily)